jgi:hypothetical protein
MKTVIVVQVLQQEVERVNQFEDSYLQLRGPHL